MCISPRLIILAVGVLWGGNYINSGTLETLQKRVGRIVIKTSSSDTAMKALKWPRRTTLFLTRTSVLVQPARAISCICLL